MSTARPTTRVIRLPLTSPECSLSKAIQIMRSDERSGIAFKDKIGRLWLHTIYSVIWNSEDATDLKSLRNAVNVMLPPQFASEMISEWLRAVGGTVALIKEEDRHINLISSSSEVEAVLMSVPQRCYCNRGHGASPPPPLHTGDQCPRCPRHLRCPED